MTSSKVIRKKLKIIQKSWIFLPWLFLPCFVFLWLSYLRVRYRRIGFFCLGFFCHVLDLFATCWIYLPPKSGVKFSWIFLPLWFRWKTFHQNVKFVTKNIENITYFRVFCESRTNLIEYSNFCTKFCWKNQRKI